MILDIASLVRPRLPDVSDTSVAILDLAASLWTHVNHSHIQLCTARYTMDGSVALDYGRILPALLISASESESLQY